MSMYGKVNLRNYLFLVVLVFIAGCAAFTKYGKLEKAARKDLEQGNFDQAFYQCVQSLRMKPDYDKGQQLIQEAFRMSVTQHENRIEELENSPAQFKWDNIVTEYETLNKINQTVETLPTLTAKETNEIIKLETKDYNQQLSTAKMNAADEHYKAGDRLSKNSSLDSQKQAAKEFKAAQRFVSGYKDSNSRYNICRRAGIKRMAIIPFENKSGKTQFGAIEDMITDDVISNVMSDQSAMEFLEIISRDQLEAVMQEQQLGLTGLIDEKTAVELGKVLGVHEILTGKITQIATTPERTTNRSFQEKARTVVGEEKYVDKNGKTKTRSKWGDVFANVTQYSKTAGASIRGSYKIVEIKTAKLKKSESFTGVYNFHWEWAKFRGDERALGNKSTTLCTKSEQYAPTDDEKVNYASRNLSESLASALKQYAR